MPHLGMGELIIVLLGGGVLALVAFATRDLRALATKPLDLPMGTGIHHFARSLAALDGDGRRHLAGMVLVLALSGVAVWWGVGFGTVIVAALLFVVTVMLPRLGLSPAASLFCALQPLFLAGFLVGENVGVHDGVGVGEGAPFSLFAGLAGSVVGGLVVLVHRRRPAAVRSAGLALVLALGLASAVHAVAMPEASILTILARARDASIADGFVGAGCLLDAADHRDALRVRFGGTVARHEGVDVDVFHRDRSTRLVAVTGGAPVVLVCVLLGLCLAGRRWWRARHARDGTSDGRGNVTLDDGTMARAHAAAGPVLVAVAPALDAYRVNAVPSARVVAEGTRAEIRARTLEGLDVALAGVLALSSAVLAPYLTVVACDVEPLPVRMTSDQHARPGSRRPGISRTSRPTKGWVFPDAALDLGSGD